MDITGGMVFWLQRKFKMHCIKNVLDTYPLGYIYLLIKSLCGTWECLACQIHGQVPTGCVLVQVLINGVMLGDIAVESQGICYSEKALWNACDTVPELVCGMPVSYRFSVPGSRGISVSCFNPVLFYWIIYFLQVMGKVSSSF